MHLAACANLCPHTSMTCATLCHDHIAGVVQCIEPLVWKTALRFS